MLYLPAAAAWRLCQGWTNTGHWRERERISDIFVMDESAAVLSTTGKKSLVWGELCIFWFRGVEITVEKKQPKDQNQEPMNEEKSGRGYQFINYLN